MVSTSILVALQSPGTEYGSWSEAVQLFSAGNVVCESSLCCRFGLCLVLGLTLSTTFLKWCWTNSTAEPIALLGAASLRRGEA